MTGVLRAIVISDCHSHVAGVATEGVDQGLTECYGSFSGDGLDPYITGLSFYRDSERSSPAR